MTRKILGSVLVALNVACSTESRPSGDGRTELSNDTTLSDDPALSNVTTLVDADRSTIVFMGTSLTAGRGLSTEEAFPALIQDTLDALGMDFRVINGGVSGETSAGGLRSIDWLLQQPISILVLELGANDGLLGLDVETMRANLQHIIDRTTQAHPEAAIVILGMEAPPNLGRQYTTAFQRVFPALAQANGATLVPFLLDSVGGIAELNQADEIHPTAEGHRIMARTVWRVLEGVVRDLDQQRAR